MGLITIYNDTVQVLVIEDDIQILDFITYILKKEGFCCVGVKNAQDAVMMLATETFDVVILDLVLPDLDGINIIKAIREYSQLPIIVVSARCQNTDIVLVLDSGADDYMTKPFSASELVARTRVALRRSQQKDRHSLQKILSVGGLQINFDKRLVSLNGIFVHMTPMEYQLLSLLFLNHGKVLTIKRIVTEIWGSCYVTGAQTLRVLMTGLRRKIEENPAKPRYILTEVGVGYRLMDK